MHAIIKAANDAHSDHPTVHDIMYWSTATFTAGVLLLGAGAATAYGQARASFLHNPSVNVSKPLLLPVNVTLDPFTFNPVSINSDTQKKCYNIGRYAILFPDFASTD
ncbi:hypothetical protein EIP91_001806 [Steccherinum ochraceum]|uniref:Uncharacterized protein n=1 Tax=Steccherinum ochraceum TaxID=92696 RepID=A0A4R0RVN0_9APHY|nr:hypothetical protein EIP91_001806 [Steccherinum ochraceum]